MNLLYYDFLQRKGENRREMDKKQRKKENFDTKIYPNLVYTILPHFTYGHACPWTYENMKLQKTKKRKIILDK